MTEMITILGMESSCDETALAIIRGKPGEPPEILIEKIHSQLEHLPYRGVVPEIAARAHAVKLPEMLKLIMRESGLSYHDLSAVAVGAGPGLIGGVIAGLMTAKGVCLAANLPLIAVNHLEAHILSPRITEKISFPYLCLTVSGGHCLIVAVYGVGRYETLGGTIDDSAGEAFDKLAKFLKIGFPGGPIVERLAEKGNPARFPLPRPLWGSKTPNFSFSGLKTAAFRAANEIELTDPQLVADLCASFQAAVRDCFIDRLRPAISIYLEKTGGRGKSFALAGGVAANRMIRSGISAFCTENDFKFFTPPLQYCTDNGTMIAQAGMERFALGARSLLSHPALARQSLDEVTL